MAPTRQVFRLAALVTGAVPAWGAGAGEVPGPGPDPEALRFRTDVMAVLAKGGCNAGGCHGAPDGKGGFQLSLFGDRPAADYEELRRGETRVRPHDPEASWVLRKPTMAMEHEGGKRFEVDSEEYEILLAWIRGGAKDDAEGAPALADLEVRPATAVVERPADSVGLEVTAVFTDGSRRDVTRWALYEPSHLNVEVGPDGAVKSLRPGEATISVRYLGQARPSRLAFVGERPGYQWAAPEPFNWIDELVFAKLERVKTNPSALCDDATFVRRATLDITGRLPDADEARAFVGDPSPDKRARLVEDLLGRPAFASFWALKWADLLRVEEKSLDEKGVATFHGWIRNQIASGRPLDEMVRELLDTPGSTYENPPANYYRALRDPATRAEATAQVFLGTRLRCAKCHNHPFERWTQDDYYRFSALFDGIDYEIIENNRKDEFDKNQFIGEQVVKFEGERKFKDPRTDKAPDPGLLEPGLALENAGAGRFRELAAWVTGNPRFAEVQANRVWSHMMGRGIVDPVDDFRATNPATNPELLEALADDFASGGFDLRRLIRTIAASRTYQLESMPNETNGEDERNFARAAVVRLPAEVLLDAVHDVVGTTPEFLGHEAGVRAVEVPGVQALFGRSKRESGDHFLGLFGKPKRLISSDTERAADTSLAQVFELSSGRALAGLLAEPDNRLGGLLNSGLSDVEVLGELYWSALGRAPAPDEGDALAAMAAAAPHRRAVFEDILWGLINSKEFLFRH